MIVIKKNYEYQVIYKSHGKWHLFQDEPFRYCRKRPFSERRIQNFKKQLKVKEIKQVKVATILYERDTELEVIENNANLGPLVLPEPEPERTYSSPLPKRESGSITMKNRGGGTCGVSEEVKRLSSGRDIKIGRKLSHEEHINQLGRELFGADV